MIMDGNQYKGKNTGMQESRKNCKMQTKEKQIDEIYMKRYNLCDDTFKQIYNTYFHYLCLQAQKILGNKEVSEDIVNDFFTSFWEKRETIHIDALLKAYLNKSIHNNCLKYNKQGTYSDVMNNINMIAEIIPNVDIVLRINYDKQTLKKIQDVLKDIKEENKCQIYVDFQKVWQVPFIENVKYLLKEAKETFRINGLNSDFWAYHPRKFYSCYSDKYHQYAINYDGKVFKCTAHDYGDDKVIGILLPDGKIEWNDALLSSLFSASTFENEQCLTCKKLPVCMGPCIQKNYNSRANNTPLLCVFDYAQTHSILLL
jgi:uncharacterized protein